MYMRKKDRDTAKDGRNGNAKKSHFAEMSTYRQVE